MISARTPNADSEYAQTTKPNSQAKTPCHQAVALAVVALALTRKGSIAMAKAKQTSRTIMCDPQSRCKAKVGEM